MPLKLKSVTEDDGKLSTHNGLRNILEWNLTNTDLSLEGGQAHHIRRVSAVESCNCKGSDTRWCNRQLEQLSNMLLIKYSNYSKCQKQPSKPEKEMPPFCTCWLCDDNVARRWVIDRPTGGWGSWMGPGSSNGASYREWKSSVSFAFFCHLYPIDVYVQNMSLLHIDVFELCLE